jgi:eukaryotic-like serine/threonine-protein kinase
VKLLEPGTRLDGFVMGECLHVGGMAHIYRVHYEMGVADPGFPMVMKIPRMSMGDGAETIVSFEVEQQIMRVLEGPHVPRLVAVGDLERQPYLVMEYVLGQTLQQVLEDTAAPLNASAAVSLGAALAQATHSLHQQNTVHLDLKPGNVLIRPDGTIVLLDFGLSCNALYPDLLAEELRKAVGSPAWMAPEQVVGVRGDPRSDVFAIGVMLYQLLTGKLPFGSPQTPGGLRQRMWMSPVPLRQHKPLLPPWLQEVVLRCLAPEAAQRYPSAAHLAFDLLHPDQVVITALGKLTHGVGAWTNLKRWVRASGLQYHASPLPSLQIDHVPIVMVAVPLLDVDMDDAVLYSLRQATAAALGTREGARLSCVTVIASGVASPTRDNDSETTLHRRHLSQLRHWAKPLASPELQTSCHVLESADVAQALVNYAVGNHVSVIVMGAATHGLMTQRFVATVPIKVAMAAPCTVILVKKVLPFERLADA